MARSRYTAELLREIPYEDRVCRIEHYPECLSPDLGDEPRATIQQEVDAIADAGADCVKFQTFRAQEFLADESLAYTYCSQGEEITESQMEMF
ncbi:MAG: N-acetylneuraminate synthase family protein, partial [Dehalococcoidia bacterium]|nr:N-acetylneuraminate synthase family protein [Dehalococcoidia bacterium]